MKNYTCKHCGGCFVSGNYAVRIYCGLKCQAASKSAEVVREWLAGGEGSTGVAKQPKQAVRNYILDRDNYSCIVCGWSERHPIDGRPLVEVDHIDGDADNCKPENLRTLCPNHHAMTDTFRARNKVSSRTRQALVAQR